VTIGFFGGLASRGEPEKIRKSQTPMGVQPVINSNYSMDVSLTVFEILTHFV